MRREEIIKILHSSGLIYKDTDGYVTGIDGDRIISITVESIVDDIESLIEKEIDSNNWHRSVGDL